MTKPFGGRLLRKSRLRKKASRAVSVFADCYELTVLFEDFATQEELIKLMKLRFFLKDGVFDWKNVANKARFNIYSKAT